MNKQLNKARQMLIDMYIESLKEEHIPWEQGWVGGYNATTNKEYKGVNKVLLSSVAIKNEYNDRRWCTFNQAKNKGWKVKKGAKGVPVEFWSIYNKVDRMTYTIKEYQQVVRLDESKEDEFCWMSRCYTVFNGDSIDGIPKELNESTKLIDNSKLIGNIINNIDVDYQEKGYNAYYNSTVDKVVLPPKSFFKDASHYYATQLHELCHATGHKSRLNRDMSSVYGTKEYAKEELRAEISSSFLLQDLDLEYDSSHFENHKAYIQSWIKILSEDPNELFRAIKDAEKISEYIKENAEINKELPIDINTAKNTKYDDFEIEIDEL